MHAFQKCTKQHFFLALLLKAAIKLCAADQLPYLGKLLKDLSNLIPARENKHSLQTFFLLELLWIQFPSLCEVSLLCRRLFEQCVIVYSLQP
jgi:hypothetical protein